MNKNLLLRMNLNLENESKKNISKVALMQPYFLPYHGYFKLIKSVDSFIIYDDAQWIKRGWINRNKIIFKGESDFITIPVNNSPLKTPINQKLLNLNNLEKYKNKIISKVHYTYKSYPYFNSGYSLLKEILSFKALHASEFIINSLILTCDYLGLTNSFYLSSSFKGHESLKGQKQVVSIIKNLNCDNYINSIGGRKLYDENFFKSQGIKLNFLSANPIKYSEELDNQNINTELSILDLIMRESPSYINDLLGDYQIL